MLRRMLASAALLLTPGLAAADGQGSFVLENDLFAGFDDDYTNGIQLSYLSGRDLLPEWVHEGAAMLPFYEDTVDVRVTAAIGQSMYTPGDITLKDPPLDDRPYAGWFYAAVGLVAKDGNRLDQLQLQIGVVGPASFADEAQSFLHSVRNLDEPRGWSHQLKNEPGVALTYQHSWRTEPFCGRFELCIDAAPHFGGAIGNVFTYANVGLTFRLGQHLPDDYGPPRIQPGLPGNGYFETDGDGEIGWYLFAGLDARAVARNIFLDGNTFTDSRDVDKHPFVGDIQVGAALTFDRFRLAYTHVFRTKEFGDDEGNDAFGAVSLTVKF